MAYEVTTALLTNGAYGYPTRGVTRRVAAKVLMCIHITDNAQNQGAAAATNERNYANRAGSTGPSAHDYINRDGTSVHAIDINHAAWSNGDMLSPKSNALVTLVKSVMASVVDGNANEAYVREVECVGVAGTAPLTAAQLERVAQLIARDSSLTGIAISRATVGQHSDINQQTRTQCAGLSEAQLAGVIARALAIQSPPVVVVPPTTYTQAQLDAAVAAATAPLTTQVTTLQASLSAAKASLASTQAALAAAQTANATEFNAGVDAAALAAGTARK